MPVVDIDTDELRGLTGEENKSDEEFKEDLFALGLEYEGDTDDGLLQFEFGPDRLDRLSVEGVARSLRYQYGADRGVYVPNTNDAGWTIEVDPSVPDERPYVTGAVVRGVELGESGLDSLIQLQEKLHATMGRGRAKGAIGVHDLTMLKGQALTEESEPSGTIDAATADLGATEKTITYRGVEPDGDRFVPLDANAEMTPAEVLAEHDTGETYADLVEDLDRYPAIYDELGLFSFPPVINGKRTEVDTESRDLFIELTGTDQWTIDKMCVILCYALSARGGTVEEVQVDYTDGATYPDEYGPELIRPDLDTDEKSVTHERIETMLGIELEREEVVDLFERSGLDAAYSLGEEETVYDVEIPPYRVDVLHPLDLVDDVGRAYGFNELEPTYPDIGTIGGRHERSRLERAVRTSLVGLGFEDMLNFHMTSAEENYDRLRLDERDPGADLSEAPLGAEPRAEITSPYSEDYTQLRTWALPSLVQVLENNTHRSYPQDLAEVGFVAHRDDDVNTRVAEDYRVAGALARTDATYEDAKARLQAVCDDFDADLETPATEHPSFLDGRVAAVVIDGDEVGVVGELHPEVLVDRDMEVPVAAFEFSLSALA
ncbi:phenylalanine--tRNA ligase subunit beta [Halobaculum magnesiiphilum]|uniref:Phenylalanine--tRNA ligase beta subunit n=1 Tax=Halobaculum magnesiiphilum TaxID=1017351 RepID=A0A8T8W9A4_9EURY|nr:phenylalanine--tRNA ligase subunit beta [Halobaculum magnesiiphilum]QZP36396.1 phenylalanine--tRNA ligase subunit beta [Halobaculum magnesiiphilum]